MMNVECESCMDFHRIRDTFYGAETENVIPNHYSNTEMPRPESYISFEPFHTVPFL